MGDNRKTDPSVRLIRDAIFGLVAAMLVIWFLAFTGLVHVGASTGSTVYSWGTFGEAGPAGPSQTTPLAIDTSSLDAPVQQAVATNSATYLLTTSGSLYAFGANGLGELGQGSTSTYTYTPVRVPLPEKIAWLPSVMPYATGVAVGVSGTAYGWGSNNAGELCLGNTNEQNSPKALTALGAVTAAAGGGGHTVWVTNKGVKACGNGHLGALGNGTFGASDTPVGVKGLSGVTVNQVYADSGTDAALVGGGTLYMWGNNEEGQLGQGNTKNSDVPLPVPLAQAVTAYNLGGNGHSDGTSFATLTNGQVVAWGADADGQACNGAKSGNLDNPTVINWPSTDTFVDGGATSYVIDSGTVYSCGQNKEGAAGNGFSSGDQVTPASILSGAVSVSSESRNVVALAS